MWLSKIYCPNGLFSGRKRNWKSKPEGSAMLWHKLGFTVAHAQRIYEKIHLGQHALKSKWHKKSAVCLSKRNLTKFRSISLLIIYIEREAKSTNQKIFQWSFGLHIKNPEIVSCPLRKSQNYLECHI